MNNNKLKETKPVNFNGKENILYREKTIEEDFNDAVAEAIKDTKFEEKSNQRKATDKYQKTKKGLTTGIYNHQKTHSKTRGHKPPEYSLKELRDWLFSQTLFHELYNDWKSSGYEKNLRPSVDRKDDDIHYMFNNLELKTWGENNAKGHKNRKEAISTQGSICKAVIKLSLDGEHICEYISQHQASRDTGIYQDYISKCCRGYKQNAGGYRWIFKKDIV